MTILAMVQNHAFVVVVGTRGVVIEVLFADHLVVVGIVVVVVAVAVVGAVSVSHDRECCRISVAVDGYRCARVSHGVFRNVCRSTR